MIINPTKQQYPKTFKIIITIQSNNIPCSATVDNQIPNQMYRNNFRDQPPGLLLQYLSKPTFPLEQLLAIPNIISDIRNNIHQFIQYLSTRKQLTQKLIFYATRLTAKQLEEEQLPRKLCFVAIQILSNEDEELVDLFFRAKGKGGGEEIEEEISANLEIENLLSNDTEIIPDGEDPFDPEEMLKYLMDYLFEGEIGNSIANNYFSKIVISLIRKSGNNFLAFMIRHPKYLDKIIENVESLSLGVIMIKLLIVDTEDCQEAGITTQECKEYKMSIMTKLKQVYFERIADLEFCESIEGLLHQGFESIKNKFFEFPEDLVNSFNSLVNEETIRRFVDGIRRTSNEEELISLVIVLSQIVRKVNKEIDEFEDNQMDKKKLKVMTEKDFILKFEIDYVIQNYSEFIRTLEKPFFQAISNLNKHKFTNLIVEMSRLVRVWEAELNFQQLISIVLNQLDISSGVLQNDLYVIAKKLIEKCPQDIFERLTFPKLDLSLTSEQLKEFKKVNNEINFGSKLNLLLLINSRRNNVLSVEGNEEQLNKVLDTVRTKHSYVLGGSEPQSKNHKWSDFSEEGFKIFTKGEQGEAEVKTQLVGKNKNIVIPNLRYMTEKKNPKEERDVEVEIEGNEVEGFKLYLGDEQINIIQVEEEEIVIQLPVCGDKVEEEVKKQLFGGRPEVLSAKDKENKVDQGNLLVRQGKLEEKAGQHREKSKQEINFYSSIYMII